MNTWHPLSSFAIAASLIAMTVVVMLRKRVSRPLWVLASTAFLLMALRRATGLMVLSGSAPRGVVVMDAVCIPTAISVLWLSASLVALASYYGGAACKNKPKE